MKAREQILALARSRAVLTLLDQAVMSGGNFLMQILLARTLAKSELGLYGVGFTVVQFLLNTQASLVTAAYMVFSPKLDEAERIRYAGSTRIHQGIIAVCATAALLAAAGIVFFTGGDHALATVLLCQSLLLYFTLFRDYARQLSFAGLRVTEALGLDTVFVVTQFLAVGALAWQHQLTAPWAFLAIGSASLVAVISWRLTTAQRFAADRVHARADWSKNWHFSRWIFGTNLAFLASNLAYPWVLYTFRGPEANGVLQACLIVGFQLINPFILGIGNFLAPRTAHALHEGGLPALKTVVRNVDVLFAVVVGGYFLALLLGGQWVLDIVTKGKYPGAAPVVHCLALGQVFFALTITANHALNALEQPNIAFQALLIASLVTWTAGVWMVWQYGPLGAAAGQALGGFAALAYTRWRFQRAVAQWAPGLAAVP